eukprot:TRINITY_DN5407_c1_g1_i1.p1 TRINITY_DN5407_c1_g1~~TRINITY_DN5407_c1_g1_i1.p1  ORF type:complete len:339 (+),score=22.02 TRINITY_DN5407_c1_g1_i1:65-1081(+)
MVLERQELKEKAVHFRSDLADVMELEVEFRSGSHGLECKNKKGYIMGEPCPDLNGEDMMGLQEWMHYYSALTVRMRCAEHEQDWVNRQEARWRARSLRKKLDDPDDEAHLGLARRERFNDPGEQVPRAPCSGRCQKHLSPFPRLTSGSSDAGGIPRQISASSDASYFPRQTSARSDASYFPRQTSARSDASSMPRQTSARSDASSFPRQVSARSNTSLSSRASMACRRWWHSCRAASRAIPMTKLFWQSPADETHFQDNALTDSECLCCERIIDESFTTGENSDVSSRSPTSARVTDESSDPALRSSRSARLQRMLQRRKAKKIKRSQVLVSCDSIIT